jgi:hypothetical protein
MVSRIPLETHISIRCSALALFSFSGFSSIPALLGMAAATGNDPVNGWRWIFRTQLVISAIVLIGFVLVYRVSLNA